MNNEVLASSNQEERKHMVWKNSSRRKDGKGKEVGNPSAIMEQFSNPNHPQLLFSTTSTHCPRYPTLWWSVTPYPLEIWGHIAPDRLVLWGCITSTSVVLWWSIAPKWAQVRKIWWTFYFNFQPYLLYNRMISSKLS